MDVPVLFLVFNRPETTLRVFEAIRQARPKCLFLVADGPRPDRPDDAARCEEVRNICSRIDWPCDATFDFRVENLGCREGIIRAINLFFEHVDSGIILEDDCLPHPDFFRFCRETLERFRDDRRVMSVGGMNMAGTWKETDQGFHFSHLYHTWGWATWKRAWNEFDADMKPWRLPECRQRIRDVLADCRHFAMCRERFDMTRSGLIEAWDYPWFFSCLLNSGLTVVPCVNLISYIGFTGNATNTIQQRDPLARQASYDFPFPLQASPFTTVDRAYDRIAFRKRFGSYPSWWLKSRLKTLLRWTGSANYERAKRWYHALRDSFGSR